LKGSAAILRGGGEEEERRRRGGGEEEERRGTRNEEEERRTGYNTRCNTVQHALQHSTTQINGRHGRAPEVRAQMCG
jgi:hypothetical protein